MNDEILLTDVVGFEEPVVVEFTIEVAEPAEMEIQALADKV